jgi:hypothetical protein
MGGQSLGGGVVSIVIALAGVVVLTIGLAFATRAPAVTKAAQTLRTGYPFNMPDWITGKSITRFEIASYRILGVVWVVGGAAMIIISLLLMAGIIDSVA